MSTSIRSLLHGAFWLAAGAGMSAYASNVTITEPLDTVTGDYLPAALTFQADNNPTNGFLHFIFASSQVDTSGTGTFVAELFEPDGVTPSDWFLVTATNGSNMLEVKFYSNPASFPVLTPTQTLNEDGTAQLVVQYSGGNSNPIDSFFVQSAITPTPEPASFLLTGITFLLGLIGFARRRAALR